MRETPHDDGLVSLADAAALLGVSTRTVRRYIGYGYLIGYRIGPKAIRVDREAVERLKTRMPRNPPGPGVS